MQSRYHANAACEEIEIAFPHLRKSSTPITAAIEVPKPDDG